MTTIREKVVAMGVSNSDLQDTDEYFEVIQTLTVGSTGSVVKDNADIINPGNNLGPTDLIQIRRRVGALGDTIEQTLSQAVNADSPLLYVPGAVTLDGAQQKVAHTALALTTRFTLEAWVTCTGKGTVGSGLYSTIFGGAAPGGLRRLMVSYDNRLVHAEMAGGAFLDTSVGTFPQGTRTHVVYTFDQSSQRLYINGVQRAASTLASGPTFNGAFWEGAYAATSTNYSFKGTLDNRAFYATALSAARVLAHYNAGV